jgi:CDP-diacylglycerol--glycerol-3-phosphate 3-phosphatidyltransferase
MTTARNLNVPNVISSLRIASVPVMIGLVWAGNVRAFTWLLLAALLSDIADGVIARVFRLQTKLGAFLDALADMGTYLSAVCGILAFQMDFVRAHWIEIGIILLFYFAEKAKTFLRYRRVFNAFHTYLSKATAYAQGVFVISLFLFGFNGYLFYPAMVLCIAANTEEMILSSLFAAYESDIKGLCWVLSARRSV